MSASSCSSLRSATACSPNARLTGQTGAPGGAADGEPDDQSGPDVAPPALTVGFSSSGSRLSGSACQSLTDATCCRWYRTELLDSTSLPSPMTWQGLRGPWWPGAPASAAACTHLQHGLACWQVAGAHHWAAQLDRCSRAGGRGVASCPALRWGSQPINAAGCCGTRLWAARCAAATVASFLRRVGWPHAPQKLQAPTAHPAAVQNLAPPRQLRRVSMFQPMAVRPARDAGGGWAADVP
jgi:hypothetical protein